MKRGWYWLICVSRPPTIVEYEPSGPGDQPVIWYTGVGGAEPWERHLFNNPSAKLIGPIEPPTLIQ